MEDRGYHGYRNYETWCVNLWLSNEEPAYRYWNSVAIEIASNAQDRDSAESDLAQSLEEELSTEMPELRGMWRDMLTAAFSGVDWTQLAEHWIDDVWDDRQAEIDAELAEQAEDE